MKRVFGVRQWVGCATVCAVLFLGGQAPGAGLISSVVETGGDNEATDTIVAQWTGQVFPVSVDNEPVPGLTIGGSYTVTPFQDLAPAFVDRNHRYTNTDAGNEVFPIPSYLVGGEYIMSGNDNRDNATYKLDVTVSSPVTAYMLIDNRLFDGDGVTPPTFNDTSMKWILDEGWAAVTTGANRTSDLSRADELGIDEGADGGINQWYSIYAKSYPAGTFSLFQADNGGRNMYGVVVVPEPSSILLTLSAGVMLLGSCRRRMAR